MDLRILNDRIAAGHAAGSMAATALQRLLKDQASVRLVVATGASQFDVLDHLTSTSDIDWSRVDAFHLDEYVGLSRSHPASFCRYLQERFVSKVPLRSMLYLDGLRDPYDVCREASQALSSAPIDLALIGIGENGHLAFNDPPADFTTTEPYRVVELDHACRQQQVGEGWFSALTDVPTHAISMSVQQIMRIQQLICTVPDERKSIALQRSLEGPVTPDVPASILQQHPNVTIYCDLPAASRLSHQH